MLKRETECIGTMIQFGQMKFKKHRTSNNKYHNIKENIDSIHSTTNEATNKETKNKTLRKI